VDTLRTFEEKIAFAVEKVKSLKDEKRALQARIDELEDEMSAKDQEIRKLTAEKTAIKGQIEGLLSVVEGLDLK
jgi:prefoldin subunit 5